MLRGPASEVQKCASRVCRDLKHVARSRLFWAGTAPKNKTLNTEPDHPFAFVSGVRPGLLGADFRLPVGILFASGHCIPPQRELTLRADPSRASDDQVNLEMIPAISPLVFKLLSHPQEVHSTLVDAFCLG